jgi:hypothetical protein
MSDAQGAIVTSLLLVGGISVAKDVHEGAGVDAVRIGLGLTGLGVGLSIMAQFSPQLATAFSVLVVIGALLKAGPDVINSTSADLFGASSSSAPGVSTANAIVPPPNNTVYQL